MNLEQILLDFSAVTGIAGREEAAVALGAKLLEPYGKVSVHPQGSLLCRVWETDPDAPHLLLDAHIDEIGFIITAIEEDGFLRVAGCGGMDRRILMASPVVIYGKQGPVYGVFCSTPPHLTGGGEKKNLKVDEMYVDIGCTKEQAEKLVFPGDRGTLYASSRKLLGDTVCGKALDNRAGCAAILYALELLKEDAPRCNLTVLFSSLEEVGGQGAKTAAYQVNPTHSIVVDVSFAHTPDAPRVKCGLMGKGPMIGFAPILSHSISRKLCDLAKEENIPFQTEIMGGKTGTNADQIASTRSGVVTGLVSIPQKYMHTPVEAVSVADVENTGRLLAAYIRSLGREEKQ